MNPPKIDSRKLDGCTVSRLTEQVHAAADTARNWEVRDSEGDLIASLPEWVPDHDKATDLAVLLMAHEERGRQTGERVGAKAERTKIAYGFEVLMAPIAEAITNAADTQAGAIDIATRGKRP